MKIERVYFGTWFQRTNLHLEEVYDFLKHGAGIRGLEQQKLDALRKGLGRCDAVFQEAHINSVEAACGATRVSITEDGVILLSAEAKDISEVNAKLASFHEKALEPALLYLFSRGAPLPKEVASIDKQGMLLAVVRDIAEGDVRSVFRAFDDEPHSHSSADGVRVFAGRHLELIDLGETKFTVSETEGFIRDLVFFREFERHLHAYLRLHRDIWDRLSKIREARTLKYADFPGVRGRIMSFQKTLGIVTARLAQMDDIMGARRSAEGKGMARLLSSLGMYNFHSLHGSRKYVSHLWEMTDGFADDTLTLLETLYQENTQRELNALKLITLFTATTSFFGMNIAFPWNKEWHDNLASSFAVAGIVVLAAVAVQWLLRTTIQDRYFVIREEKKKD